MFYSIFFQTASEISYVVVVDAGSTGSRIFVFAFNKTSGKQNNLLF